MSYLIIKINPDLIIRIPIYQLVNNTVIKTCTNIIGFFCKKISAKRCKHLFYIYCAYILYKMYTKPVPKIDNTTSKIAYCRYMTEYLFAYFIKVRISAYLRKCIINETNYLKYFFLIVLWDINVHSLEYARRIIPRLNLIYNGITMRIMGNIDEMITKIYGMGNIDEIITKTSGMHKIINNPEIANCIICMDKSPQINFLVPCGHGIFCIECKDKISDCPICNTKIIDRIRVYPSSPAL